MLAFEMLQLKDLLNFAAKVMAKLSDMRELADRSVGVSKSSDGRFVVECFLISIRIAPEVVSEQHVVLAQPGLGLA